MQIENRQKEVQLECSEFKAIRELELEIMINAKMGMPVGYNTDRMWHLTDKFLKVPFKPRLWLTTEIETVGNSNFLKHT